MLAIVGTVPDPDFPVTIGQVRLQDNHIEIEGRDVPIDRGTPALIAAVLAAGKVVSLPRVTGFLAGDIGLGDGSRTLYQHLEKTLSSFPLKVITFHYLQPEADWHNRVLFAIQEMKSPPTLIADAGFMYAAKMSGQAQAYDLFTPDIGELTFLADEEAPHPFYTRGFLFHREDQVEDLITLAYQGNNAAGYLLVKGKTDRIADKNGVIREVAEPSSPPLEAIGGTGDTLCGIVSALVAGGMDIPDAAIIAAKANRIAGCLASPCPATQIKTIIHHIPMAIRKALSSSMPGSSY